MTAAPWALGAQTGVDARAVCTICQRATRDRVVTSGRGRGVLTE